MFLKKIRIRKSHLLFFMALIPALLIVWAVMASDTATNGQEPIYFMPFVAHQPEVTVTPTPTHIWPTPSGSFLHIVPTCGYVPETTFYVVGGNWPTNEDITFYWYDPHLGTDELVDFIIASHSGTLSRSWTRSVVTDTTYMVKAASEVTYPYPSGMVAKDFIVPCHLPPTQGPPPPTDTPSPEPEDLTIGQLDMISTPPIVAYQPVQFRAVISNTGDFDVNDLFFVDLYIDPGIPIPSGMISIPLGLTDGFTAVSHIPSNSQQTITITSQFGFTNTPENHLIYAMVDSTQYINELQENNNISTPLPIINITPADTFTPTPTPNGMNPIAGIVYIRINTWQPAYRARVTFIDSANTVVAQTFTESNGHYQFINLSPDTYTVQACYELDGVSYSGIRTNITPPDPLVNIFMLQGPCP